MLEHNNIIDFLIIDLFGINDIHYSIVAFTKDYTVFVLLRICKSMYTCVSGEAMDWDNLYPGIEGKVYGLTRQFITAPG